MSGRQRWTKIGLVFRSPGDQPWRLTHAATPTVEPLGGAWVRVYYTARDAANRSHVSSVELDVRNPTVTRALSAAPLVAPGPSGAFDADGSAMGCLVRDGSRRLLYYLGWRLAKDVPWRNTIGLAIADGDSTRFEKAGDGPVVGLNDVDPHSVSYPWILREGAVWRMWYGSNLMWGTEESSMRHVIKYAESRDGVQWKREGRVAIPLPDPAREFAVSRPCVVRDGDSYRMWYSRRTPVYAMGFATSPDGIAWSRRDDEVGLEPTRGAWDGASVEYPNVFDADGDRWMLYNGDDYGRAGFGLARLER